MAYLNRIYCLSGYKNPVLFNSNIKVFQVKVLPFDMNVFFLFKMIILFTFVLLLLWYDISKLKTRFFLNEKRDVNFYVHRTLLLWRVKELKPRPLWVVLTLKTFTILLFLRLIEKSTKLQKMRINYY